MKQKFTETEHCQAKVHCAFCRTDPAWRQNIMSQFEWDGECPHGVTADTIPERKKMPPLKKQFKNLAQAVGRAISNYRKTGKVVVNKKTRKKRIRICEGCEELTGFRCIKCGCATAAKVALRSEKCPIDKW